MMIERGKQRDEEQKEERIKDCWQGQHQVE